MPEKTMEIQAYLRERRELVEAALARLMLSASGPFARHIEAMRYSLFSGGKRLRPILCLAAADAVDGSEAARRSLWQRLAAYPGICAYYPAYPREAFQEKLNAVAQPVT